MSDRPPSPRKAEAEEPSGSSFAPRSPPPASAPPPVPVSDDGGGVGGADDDEEEEETVPPPSDAAVAEGGGGEKEKRRVPEEGTTPAAVEEEGGATEDEEEEERGGGGASDPATAGDEGESKARGGGAEDEEEEEAAPSPPPPTEGGAAAAADAAAAATDEEAPSPTAAPVPSEEGAPAPPPPPPPPAAPRGPSTAALSSHDRALSHSRLRSYESNRRSAYSSKLGSSKLYWRSFRDLLHASLEETERAEGIVRGTATANGAYGEHMAGCYEDSLDGGGKLVTDAKKKKKLMEGRNKRRARYAGDGGHARGAVAASSSPSAAAGAASPASGTTAEGEYRLKVSDASYHDAAEKRSGMLCSLIESHAVLAERYSENSRFVAEEIVPEITALSSSLGREVKEMERLGNALLKELEGAEEEVAEAWDAYYESATKSLGGAGGDAADRRRRSGAVDAAAAASSSGAADENAIVEDCVDVWVVEMRYRVAVAYLSSCWDKSSAELSKLFASMKETECSRRFRLRELLVAFLQRQERLWLSLPSCQQPVLRDLSDRRMDRGSIEGDVQTSIRLRAQAIQREEQAASKKRGGGRAKDGTGKGLSGVDASEGDFVLSSPLVSDLLCKARVVEKRGSGMMSSWKTVLAVVTSDSFLHLFDLPAGAKVQGGTAPEVAFHTLVPPVEVPTPASMKASGGKPPSAASAKAWRELLAPSESLVLPNCAIAFKDENDNSTFEIHETYVSSGASKVFGRTAHRKLYFRTVTRSEAADWIEVLKAEK